jgi:hypothetical protein
MNGYPEGIQRHNHPVVMPKTFNGITIQFEWLPYNHPMVMLKTLNGITIPVEWLC